MANSFRPEHLSYSALQLYENCPHCYYLQYALQLKKPETPALQFGKAYHEGLAQYRTNGDFYEGFKRSIAKQCISVGVASGYLSDARIMFEHYKLFGEKFVPSTKIPRPIEHEFKTMLINPVTKTAIPIPFKGFMDLVTDDDAIVDDKTSGTEYGDEKRNDRQLLIYSMIFRKLYSRPPSRLVFSVHMKDTKIGRWQKYEQLPDATAEAIEFINIRMIVMDILAGKFQPKDSKSFFFTHFPVCPYYVPPRKKKY